MTSVLIGGLSIGALYALVAVGIVLISRTTGVVNFGQSEFLMIGGYAFVLAAGVTDSAGLQLGVNLAVGAICGLLFFVITRFGLRKAFDPLTVVIGTLALVLLLRAAARELFTDDPKGAEAWLVGDQTLPIAGGIATLSVLAVVFTLVLTLVLVVWITRTLLGKAMSAVAEDGWRASLSGIPVNLMLGGSWALGGALAGLAGLFLSARVGAYPDMGAALLLPAFIAAILGGFQSLTGALLGGLILGVSQSWVVFQFGGFWRDAATFLLLLIILLIRPTGLVAERAGRSV